MVKCNETEPEIEIQSISGSAFIGWGKEMKYTFSRFMKKLEFNEKIILVNAQNGKWIKISKKIYNIVNLLKKYSYEQLLDALYDDFDRKYMVDILSKIIGIELLVSENQVISSNKTVIFEITNRCNLYCNHCCNNASTKSDFELDTETVKIILKYIVEKNPVRITLSGGEPMIRKDFFDILEYLRSIYKGKISVMTNGTFINMKAVQKFVRYIDEINISIDGVDEATCEIVRGKGVFTKVMEGIELLRDFSFPQIALSMVFGDSNRHLLKRFIQLNEELETTPLIRSFVAAGRGVENKELYYEGNIYENIDNYLSDEVLELKDAKKLSPCSCSAAHEKILIDYKGDIYPCQWFKEAKYCLGNVVTNKLENLNAASVVQKVDMYCPDKYEKCKVCEVNLFCWPCPGELKTLVDGKESLDDICKKVKPILMKHIWEMDKA